MCGRAAGLVQTTFTEKPPGRHGPRLIQAAPRLVATFLLSVVLDMATSDMKRV